MRYKSIIIIAIFMIFIVGCTPKDKNIASDVLIDLSEPSNEKTEINNSLENKIPEPTGTTNKTTISVPVNETKINRTIITTDVIIIHNVTEEPVTETPVKVDSKTEASPRY